jgi:hypothetical protein
MDFDAVQSRTMAIPIRTMAYSLLCRSTLQPRLQLRLHETGRLAIASHCRRTKDSSPPGTSGASRESF